jgi:hypothetical protein
MQKQRGSRREKLHWTGWSKLQSKTIFKPAALHNQISLQPPPYQLDCTVLHVNVGSNQQLIRSLAVCFTCLYQMI